MKTKKKILALLLSLVMSVVLIPGAALAAETGTPSAICEATEGCTLEAGHDGECVLHVEDNIVSQTQAAADQIDPKAGNSSWDDIIDQIHTIPRSDTWNGIRSQEILYKCGLFRWRNRTNIFLFKKSE